MNENETRPQYLNRDYKAERDRKLAEGKNLGGRPRLVLNYEALKAMCAFQATGEECAHQLKMHYETLNDRLRQDYREALERDPENVPYDYADGFLEFFKKHHSAGLMSVRRAQFMAATDKKNPNTRLLLHLGVQWLGQKVKLDLSSEDGTMTPKADLTKEQLLQELQARGLPTTIFGE